MAEIYKNVLETIGHTPIIELKRSVPDNGHIFLGKVEFYNPGGSIKDRIALSIIEEAEEKGLLKPGGTIVEATSGNTGVGLAMVAAIKGYKCIFVMPDKISEEKRATLRAYGARVVITPTGVEPDDPRSHYMVAAKFVEITPNNYYTNQYHNPANPKIHYETTGPEIWEQTGGKIDCFVGGAGTGGTLSGVGRYLKEKNPKIKIVCADPFGSILFDMFYFKEVRTKPHSYLVEGIGEDMMPENVHFNVWDDIVQLTDAEIFQKTRDISSKEGLLVGPSCGAALAGAIKYSQSGKLAPASRIVVLLPDGGRSYLSKVYNESWMREKNLLAPLLTQFTVKDLMTKLRANPSLPHAKVETTIKDAVHLIKEKGLTRLPVLSGQSLIGTIEIVDLLMALANGKLRADEPVLHLVQSSSPEVETTLNLEQLEHALVREPFVRVKKSGEMISRADLADFISSMKESN
jgi:cystathionine beta-synthase